MTLETILLLISAIGGSSFLTILGQGWATSRKAKTEEKKFDHEYLLESFKISIDAITKQRDDAFARVESMQERMIALELEIMGLRLMLGHDPFPRWIVNTSGEYLFVNQAFETYFLHPRGQVARDVVGKNHTQVWDKDISEKLKKLASRASKSPKLSAHSEICLNETSCYEFYKMPIKVNDIIVGHIGYAISSEEVQ